MTSSIWFLRIPENAHHVPFIWSPQWFFLTSPMSSHEHRRKSHGHHGKRPFFHGWFFLINWFFSHHITPKCHYISLYPMDFPMIFPWFSDFPMIFPWIFPWFSHDFLIFPWFSHGFSPEFAIPQSPLKKKKLRHRWVLRTRLLAEPQKGPQVDFFWGVPNQANFMDEPAKYMGNYWDYWEITGNYWEIWEYIYIYGELLGFFMGSKGTPVDHDDLKNGLISRQSY